MGTIKYSFKYDIEDKLLKEKWAGKILLHIPGAFPEFFREGLRFRNYKSM